MSECPGCKGTRLAYLTVLGSDEDLILEKCPICGGTGSVSGFAVFHTADWSYKNTFQQIFSDENDAQRIASMLRDGRVVAL